MQIKNTTEQPRAFHVGPKVDERRLIHVPAGETVDVKDDEFRAEAKTCNVLKGWLDSGDFVVVGPRISVTDEASTEAKGAKK